MDLYGSEEIASVNFYTLRLAEGELMLYEACINYILENCPSAEDLYEKIGCASKSELQAFQKCIITVLKQKTDPVFLPKRINESSVPTLDLSDCPICISLIDW